MLTATKAQALSELSAARKDLADKSSKFTDQHPDVRSARSRVAQAEAALNRAEDAIQAAQPPPSLPADGPGAARTAAVEIATPKPLALEPRQAKKPKPAAGDNSVVGLEIEWVRLSRGVGLARARQADLEQKLYQAEMVASTAESGHGTNISVLDPAYKPSGPSNAPNKTVVVLGLGISIVLGIVLSAVWGLFLDDRVFAASEIEAVVMLPVIGVIPRPKHAGGRSRGPLEKAKG